MKIQTILELNSAKRNINNFQGRAWSVLEIIKSKKLFNRKLDPMIHSAFPPVSDAI